MTVEGVDYLPEAIEQAREELIQFRNDALKSNAFGIAVLLSHVIAYLWDYKELKSREV